MYINSKYNFCGRLDDGNYLIYNLVSSSVAILSKSEYETICSPTQHEKEDSSFIRECAEYGFIVPKDENETEKIILLRNLNNFDNHRAGFQILPTTFCNARCSYCYENGFIGQTMTPETASKTVEFIKNYVANADSLNITWFGGEPFMAKPLIKSMSEELIRFCEERKILYNADAITNGSLIDDDSIESLYEDCRINRLQITIDGKGEEYSKRKNYRDKGITYEDLLKKIGILTQKGIKVLIRLNIDRDNISSILDVIDDISGIDGDPDRMVVYASPLYSKGQGDSCLLKDELVSAYTRIYHKLIDNGLIKSVDELPMNYSNSVCAAKGANNFVISPGGDIYKCEHLLDAADEIVGNVETGIVCNDALSRWNDPAIHEKCYDCKHLPICQGGCYAADIQNFGYWRCSYITFLDDVIIDAANYLIKRREEER